MIAWHDDEAFVQGRKAIALAESEALNRLDILCHALNNVSCLEQRRDPRHGRNLLDRSLEIALANDFQDHVANTYTNRACFEAGELVYDQAKTFLEAGISYCIEHGLNSWLDYLRGRLADVLLRQGHWDKAAATAMLVVANDEATPLNRFPSVMVLAKLRIRRGDPAADLLAELSISVGAGMELSTLGAYAVLTAERAWLGQADKIEALQLLERAVEMARTIAVAPEVIFWKRILGVDHCAHHAPGLPRPYHLFFEGDWRGAAELWSNLGAPFEQALCLLEGDPDAQYSALAFFESLGATAVVEHVQLLMQKRGLRVAARTPRASTRANPAGLTKRQMDVLRLIDQGRSNTKIAAALFVSPKTVDHHISAILGKLDAKSRGEAAAIARSSGLIGR